MSPELAWFVWIAVPVVAAFCWPVVEENKKLARRILWFIVIWIFPVALTALLRVLQEIV